MMLAVADGNRLTTACRQSRGQLKLVNLTTGSGTQDAASPHTAVRTDAASSSAHRPEASVPDDCCAPPGRRFVSPDEAESAGCCLAASLSAASMQCRPKVIRSKDLPLGHGGYRGESPGTPALPTGGCYWDGE